MAADPRVAALEQMLAQGGKGLVAENATNWQQIVQPALSRPVDARTARTDKAWADRNSRVGGAQSAMLGAYGGALDMTRQQAESEWMRKFKEKQAKRGSGRSSSSSSSSSDDTTTPLPPTAPQADPWAWVNDYIDGLAYSGPPSVNPKPPTTPRNPRPGQGSSQVRYM